MQQSCSEETVKKQTYLRQQVIEEGYSAQDFFQYLVSLKKDGSNIDNWSFEELVNVVRNYKSKQTQLSSNSSLPQEKVLANYETTINKDVVSIFEEKDKRIEYEKHNLFDMAFKRKIETVSFKGFLSDYSTPEVFVEKPQIKINPGLFFGIGRSVQLWYVIRSNIVNISIKRTDGDMDWLRSTLLKLYPGYIIPPFTKCTTDLEKEQSLSLQRRSKMCHFYLNALAQHRLISNTKLFVGFVSWTDYNKFCDLKKQYDKMQSPKTVRQMPSQTGNIEIELSTRNRCVVKAVDVFANSLDSIHDKIQCELHNTGRDFDKAAETLLKVSNCFAEMQEQYSHMVNYAPDTKCDKFSEIIIAVNNTFFGWGRLLQQVKKQLNEHVGIVFRFCREQNRIIRDNLAKRKDLQSHYLKLKGELLQRKSKLYMDPSQWQIPPSALNKAKSATELSREEVIELLLPKQTQQESQMRDQLSFLNKSIEKEFLRMTQVLAKRLKDVFGGLCEQLSSNAKLQSDLLLRLKTISDPQLKRKM